MPSKQPSTSPSPPPSGSKKRTSSFVELEVDLAAPEPPSKRARRALKKGKPLPKKADSDDDVGSNRDAASDDDAAGEQGKAKKPERSEHGVWIGNLPFTVDEPALKSWLIDNSGGAITAESITRMKMPRKEKPNEDKTVKTKQYVNKGFAYVDFQDLVSKTAAVALSETTLQNRNLLIKDSKSFEGRPQKVPDEATAVQEGGNGRSNGRTGPGGRSDRKVFVGNLGFDVTEDELRTHFEKCGPIQWVKVAQFEDSGKCKGYGWVQFTEPLAASWAVKGYTKYREEVDTEEDFREPDDENGEDGDADAAKGGEGAEGENGEPERRRKTRMRKWWVNRLKGRQLKIELAEDDQARYNKRFGKGSKMREERKTKTAGEKDGATERTAGAERKAMADSKPLKTHGDINQARLMGVAVKPAGKKTTFD